MENLLEQWGPLCTTIGVGTAVAGLAATYYVAKMPDPTCIPPVDLDDQSYVLEVSKIYILALKIFQSILCPPRRKEDNYVANRRCLSIGRYVGRSVGTPCPINN